MRAVHAYFNVQKRSLCAYQNEFDILVWKLSVIRNKKLGFTTVLYTTPEDMEFILFYKLHKYYDEINFIKVPENINLLHFWACAKFEAIKEEIKLGNDFFIVDTDLVFMDDTIVSKLNENDNLFWLNNEPAENYANLAELSRPKDFKYPYYFSPLIRPINTAILRIKNNEIYKTWLDVAYRFMRNNPCKACDSGALNLYTIYIVTAEQRFLPNVLLGKYKQTPNFFCDLKNKNFGLSHFHIWGTKHLIKGIRNLRRSWIKTLLLIIKQECLEEYTYIIGNHGPDVQDTLQNWDSIKLCDKLSIYVNE